ncbi:DNA repair protein RecN [Oceanidesulfovibrio marinus]|uniref:DNA repair protein RecN n=1 Tax=Oceanidesulfovibrio marinus TaxID=370038 RepID=A0A6P1ZET5_9BACT|nr:AAA family ATPase [Oceanidesulfovibrio marinus]TVM33154.1 DNA repair protein RecN [Oceanidesulfovibrio marinus]
MLEYLRIRNLALIDDLELDFASGLNALTGETGAGKSFILKALGFLTGDKLETSMVRPGAEKATVEAIFVLDGEQLVISRELSADSGRSRVSLNDSLSSQDRIKAMRPQLLIHASQHGQQRLLQPSFQAQIIDSKLPDRSLLDTKDALVREIRSIASQREEMEDKCRELETRREFLEFQQKEIDKVAPEAGEEEALETRRRAVRDMAFAREAVDNGLELLRNPETGGVIDSVDKLGSVLATLEKANPAYATESERLTEVREFFIDLEAKLRRESREESADSDIEAIESRLFELAQLKRKLKRSLEEIVDLGREIQENLSFLDACGLDRQRLAKEEKAAAAKLQAVLQQLNDARSSAAEGLCRALEKELAGLGFSEHVAVSVEFTPHPLFPDSSDDEGNAHLASLVEQRARFLWQPNPGQPAQPLDQIASGGELSRFLLALVTLSARGEDAALIFDEVDAGVGGRTLNRLADRIRNLASQQQVLLITHWPQLAATADRHFLVEKHVENGQTYTRCRRLNTKEVKAELDRMAGGEAGGDPAPLLRPM